MVRIVLIVNGKYKNAVQKATAFKKLLSEDFAVDCMITAFPGESVELSKKAIAGSCTHIIVFGGDGTLHEVVNGIYEAKEENPTLSIQHLRLGLFPCGTGNDFARSIHPVMNMREWKDLIAFDRFQPVDVGYLEISGKRSYFINVADAGLGGEVVDHLRRFPKLLNPFLTYQLAIIKAILTYKKKWIRLSGNGIHYEGPVLSVIFANGRYFGGGLCIAPDAKCNDQQLELIILGDISMWDYLRKIGKVKAGKKIDHPQVHYFTGNTFTLEHRDGPLTIEADGEFKGSTPLMAGISNDQINWMG